VLTLRGADPRSFRRGFAPASLAIGCCVLLVGSEDFGTSVLLLGVGVCMLFVAGCRLRHLAMLGGLGACALVGLLFSAPYRLARITAYADIWADPRGSGYQPLQSLAAIASGGWFGKGLGAGVQKHGYLPESRTDFIFAVICEEMGVFGACVVIALFCVFVWLGLRTMLMAPTRFERLVAFGLTVTVALQAAMNIAVVTVVTPTTGISLPLVSAGGSGVVTFCLAVGILAGIAARGRAQAGLARQGNHPIQGQNATWDQREVVAW
jgi:cell division protein FtsW